MSSLLRPVAVLAVRSRQRPRELEPDHLAFHDGSRIHDLRVRKGADRHKLAAPHLTSTSASLICGPEAASCFRRIRARRAPETGQHESGGPALSNRHKVEV